jgi:hypothetical protein
MLFSIQRYKTFEVERGEKNVIEGQKLFLGKGRRI